MPITQGRIGRGPFLGNFLRGFGKVAIQEFGQSALPKGFQFLFLGGWTKGRGGVVVVVVVVGLILLGLVVGRRFGLSRTMNVAAPGSDTGRSGGRCRVSHHAATVLRVGET